jgi:hypothetical protein
VRRRTQILLSILLGILLAYYLLTPRQVNVSARSDQPGERAVTTQAENSQPSDWHAVEQQTRTQIAELARLESRQAMRERAQQQHGEEIGLLQTRATPAWQSLLETNRGAFQALSRKAAAAPNHSVHCTLCDGTGMLDHCVLCGHTGKCVRCDGTGRLLGQYCPACVGTGKCGLCFGSGKMACPFCDDGVIEAKSRFPPALPPVH